MRLAVHATMYDGDDGVGGAVSAKPPPLVRLRSSLVPRAIFALLG